MKPVRLTLNLLDAIRYNNYACLNLNKRSIDPTGDGTTDLHQSEQTFYPLPRRLTMTNRCEIQIRS